ncbi:unnamed protein product [Clavelina lepadiformis]|uniref:Integrator complex subunit 2 n=1 Tax=Clavelina lepadiformis TaxID=159417 RepID=A0ABP0GPK1_CLALP
MLKHITPHVFKLMNNLKIMGLLSLQQQQVRPLLPSLVRMSLCSSLDTSAEWQEKRKYLLQLLSGIDAVNDIIALLSVDFHDLEEDARKEQQTRMKLGTANSTEGSIAASVKRQGIVLEFERSEPSRRFRIVLSELLPILMQLDSNESHVLTAVVESELFSCDAYLQDVSDVLCILCAELPSLLKLTLVAETLLYFPNGTSILCKLVANNPESFLPICNGLLRINNTTRESRNRTFDENMRSKALHALCRMSPECALTIRNLCVQNCQLPELVVSLTLDNSNVEVVDRVKGIKQMCRKSVSDLVAFVCGLLLGNDSKVRSWFATYVRHQKDDTDCRLREELLNELRDVVKTSEVNETGNETRKSESEELIAAEALPMHLLLDENCLSAAALIRLYCAMKVIAGIKFSKEESDLLLRLITCFPPLTPAGIRFVSLALGMLLACPALITGTSQEKQVVSWIKWLACRSSEMESVGPDGCSFAEQLLLTAIHLHGDRYTAAVRLACATLGMRVKVSPSSLGKLRHIFTEEVFPTHVVAAHATKIPVTKNLNAAMPGYLPVHCIYQLLKTRTFSQSRVPVKDWIYKQICSAESPLHPQLLHLVTQYVNTVVTPLNKAHNTHHDGIRNEPFTESQILSVFGIKSLDDKNVTSFIDPKSTFSLTSKLLMLYYVLLYEDMILNNMKTLALLPCCPSRYSSGLINMIPVKFLLHKAQRLPKSCQGLYPALLGLLTTHLPHLCLVEDWMQDLDYLLPNSMTSSILLKGHDFTNSIEKGRINITAKQLYNGLQKSIVNPAPALMHLQTLSHPNISAEDVIPFADALTSGLPFILDDKVSRRVHQEAQKLWLKLNSIVPRKLWVLTINALQSSLIKSKSSRVGGNLQPITFDHLVDNPLLPLTVDVRVLHCPELLSIMLRILSACLSASRSQSSALLRANPTLDSKPTNPRSTSPLGNNAPVTEAEKEELRSALNAAQNSAAVQLLVEICLSPDEDGKDMSLNLLTYQREVQCLVCSTLHQMFIEDPNVAKLVHFQGYPSKLVATLVAGVPSMHICLDFVPELLQQSQPSQQLFGIELASQLCLHYSLPKSLSIARLCVNVIATLITVVPLNERCAYFSRAITALPNFAKAFPPVVRECVSILQQLGRIAHAHIASHHPHIISQQVSSDEDWSFETVAEFEKSLKSNEKDPLDPHVRLYQDVRATFYKIVQNAVPV